MGLLSWQSRTTLLGTWVLLPPMPPQHGGPHARYTRIRPARPRSLRLGLLPSHLPTLPRPAPRRSPDHRPSQRLQPAAHRRDLGPRRPLQLSPRLLETALVGAGLGSHPDPLHPRSLGPRGADLPGRRRYRRRASRRQGLWQGVPSRPGALHSFVHRLSLGAQMGRPGHPGQVPLRESGLGPAGARGLVSQPGEGPGSQGRGRQGPPQEEGQGPGQGQGQGQGAPPAARPRPRPRSPRLGRGRGGCTRRPRN